jgi:large subunit ribosomal protein L24
MSSGIKKGEEVVVITGASKGQRGRVLQVLPKKERVVIEGLNFVKKHQKARSEQDEGGIIEREGSIHISNVMLGARYDARKEGKAKS